MYIKFTIFNCYIHVSKNFWCFELNKFENAMFIEPAFKSKNPIKIKNAYYPAEAESDSGKFN